MGGMGSAELRTLAERRKRNGEPYPGAAVACEGRTDLAGLPFRLGIGATLSLEKAQAMNGLSKQLRQIMQHCVRNVNDPRPDTDALHKMLTGNARGGFHISGEKTWATAEAVPCIQQMLQVENHEIRRMSVELLRRIEAREATEALAQWAVFDTDASNRAAAVAALKSRDRGDTTRLLLQYVRYPWPRAAEHAAEALVALDCKETVPQLAGYYDLPDPDAPFRVLVPAPKAAPAAVAKVDPKATAELDAHVKGSSDPDAAVRKQAAVGLATFLRDSDVRLRRKAALALAAMGSEAEPASEALREAAKDTDVEVRTATRQTLEEIEEVAAVRKKAEIGKAAAAVAKDLKAVEPEDRVKTLHKIAAFGPDANVVGESVIEAMRDKVGAVQTAAAEALAKINPEVSPHIVTILTPRGTGKREAIAALGELGAKARIAVPFLIYCNDNPFFWGGGNPKAGKFHEDLFPTIAKIAPQDKRFAESVLGCISAPNPRRDRTLRDRRLSGIAQLKTIDATTADKVGALVAALGDEEAIIEVIGALEQIGEDAKVALPGSRRS